MVLSTTSSGTTPRRPSCAAIASSSCRRSVIRRPSCTWHGGRAEIARSSMVGDPQSRNDELRSAEAIFWIFEDFNAIGLGHCVRAATGGRYGGPVVGDGDVPVH